jgi:hypothetical protein
VRVHYAESVIILILVFTNSYQISMNIYEITSVILAIGSFGLILFIGLKTNILLETAPVGSSEHCMYSLGRFQLWIWTLVICPIFSLFWGFDNLHAIDLNVTGTLLLGIPSGVAITGSIISSTQSSNVTTEQHVSAMDSPDTADTVVLKMHRTSKNFFIDLISDDSGNLSLGRLQQLIFTCLFVVIYITTFFSASMQSLPEFQNEVFILMGISSGTYLVAKGLNK